MYAGDSSPLIDSKIIINNLHTISFDSVCLLIAHSFICCFHNSLGHNFSWHSCTLFIHSHLSRQLQLQSLPHSCTQQWLPTRAPRMILFPGVGKSLSRGMSESGSNVAAIIHYFSKGFLIWQHINVQLDFQNKGSQVITAIILDTIGSFLPFLIGLICFA